MFLPFLESGTSRQIYATLCSNLLAISYGTSIGWASTSLPYLESNETLLETGPLSKDGTSFSQLLACQRANHFVIFTIPDTSWIQSVFTIGGFLGNNSLRNLSTFVTHDGSLRQPNLRDTILVIFLCLVANAMG